MSEIKFDFLPFKVYSNYYKCKKELKDIKNVELLDKYNCEVEVRKIGLFDVEVIINIKDTSMDAYRFIRFKLLDNYYEPSYASGFEPNIWSFDGFYIEHYLEVANLSKVVHTIKISSKNRYSKIASAHFDLIHIMFNKISKKLNLSIGIIECIKDGSIKYELLSKNDQYFITITNKEIILEKTCVEYLFDKTAPIKGMEGTIKQYKSIHEVLTIINTYFESQDLDNKDDSDKDSKITLDIL